MVAPAVPGFELPVQLVDEHVQYIVHFLALGGPDQVRSGKLDLGRRGEAVDRAEPLVLRHRHVDLDDVIVVPQQPCLRAGP